MSPAPTENARPPAESAVAPRRFDRAFALGSVAVHDGRELADDAEDRPGLEVDVRDLGDATGLRGGVDRRVALGDQAEDGLRLGHADLAAQTTTPKPIRAIGSGPEESKTY